MAFTRKFLSSLGIEDDKIETIITAHAEVVDALKDERDSYKADAEKLPAVQKELDDFKNGAGYEEKYNALKDEYDKYKAGIDEEKSIARKTEAYKALLKDTGISEKRIAGVCKYDADTIKGIELDDKGAIKDADNVKSHITEEWKEFIVKEETHGTNTATPPAGNGKAYKSKEEIMAIEDDDERQKAILDNHDMFGF